MKRFVSNILSAAMLASCFTSAGALCAGAAESNYLQHDSFDSSVGSWKGRGDASIAVTNSEHYAGSGSLSVTGRTAEWNGAAVALSSSDFVPGKSYSFSVNAMQSKGNSNNVTLCLKLQYTDSSDETKYDPVAEATTMRGEWVQLANSEYTIPADASDMSLYVETTAGSYDFFIDESIIASAGTAIEGPGPKVMTLGDLNFDGQINIIDFCLAKNMLLQQISGDNGKFVADVNSDGQNDISDAKLIFDYMIGAIDKFPDPPIPVEPDKPPFDYNPALSFKEAPGNYFNQCSQSGKIIKETYNGINGSNTLNVYLPYGYDSSKKYNIFYLMHGGGENENTIFSDDVKIGKMLDNMIMNGDIEPMIVVTPTFNKCSAQTFYKEWRASVIPFVEGKYSTYAESTSAEDIAASRMHRAYGGFSMGSCSTWAGLVNSLDICAYWMPLSGDNWEASGGGYAKAKSVADAVDRSGLAKNQYFIFCATGSEDIAYPNMNPQIDEMKKMSQFIYTSDFSKGNFYYLVAQGKTHWWGYVRHYVYDALPYFFHE